MKLSDTSVKIYVVKRYGATQVELVELEDHIIPTAAADKFTYALAFNTQGNKVMFGLVENGVVLPAFKAYIELDNAAGATAPLFIALPTAVEAAKVQTTKAGATYDLTVLRVQQTAKGKVYVRDGKKFVQQQNSSYV